jgi:hypothetical protein
VNEHIAVALIGFGAAYFSSAIYWLNARFRGIWSVVAVLLFLCGCAAILSVAVSAGTGTLDWDWWVVPGWVMGWIAWAATKAELHLT